jgi:hypothetical protein
VPCQRPTIQSSPKPQRQKFHPSKPHISREKTKIAVLQVIKNVKNPIPPNRAKKRQTSINTDPNNLHASKVLNNSPTTIPARPRKFRHFKPPSCAKIQPENTQQSKQSLDILFPSTKADFLVHAPAWERTLQPESENW